jgi:polyphosphate kinase 2 (PPK2 family)
MLAEEGTTILKFFLHISKGEQKKRLQARLDERDKRWRFNVGDLKERKLWPAYMRAYEDAISKTSTRWAPWYVVPADHKWYRNLVVATIMVETLKSLKMRYPEPEVNLDGIVIK